MASELGVALQLGAQLGARHLGHHHVRQHHVAGSPALARLPAPSRPFAAVSRTRYSRPSRWRQQLGACPELSSATTTSGRSVPGPSPWAGRGARPAVPSPATRSTVPLELHQVAGPVAEAVHRRREARVSRSGPAASEPSSRFSSALGQTFMDVSSRWMRPLRRRRSTLLVAQVVALAHGQHDTQSVGCRGPGPRSRPRCGPREA